MNTFGMTAPRGTINTQFTNELMVNGLGGTIELTLGIMGEGQAFPIDILSVPASTEDVKRRMCVSAEGQNMARNC